MFGLREDNWILDLLFVFSPLWYAT